MPRPGTEGQVKELSSLSVGRVAVLRDTPLASNCLMGIFFGYGDIILSRVAELSVGLHGECRALWHIPCIPQTAGEAGNILNSVRLPQPDLDPGSSSYPSPSENSAGSFWFLPLGAWIRVPEKRVSLS